MSPAAAWFAETAEAATLLMLLVLAARPAARRWLGPRQAYALWLIPALRLLFPPLRVALVPQPVAMIGRIVGEAAAVPLPARLGGTSLAAGLDPGALLLCLWLAGAGLWLWLQLWRYRRFVESRLRDAALLRVEGRVGIYLADVEGPLAGGLVRPFVLLPRDFESRYPPTQQRLAIAHELAHHRRGDIFANAAAMLVLALFWWNPVAHLACRAFRSDQELACDASVLSGRTAADRRAYALAIAGTALGRGAAPGALLRDPGGLKRRLRLVGDTRDRSGGGRSATAWLVGLATLLLTASSPPVAAMAQRIARAGGERLALLAPARQPSRPRRVENAPAPPTGFHFGSAALGLKLPRAKVAAALDAQAQAEPEAEPSDTSADSWTTCLDAFAAAERGGLPASLACERERGRRASLAQQRREALERTDLSEADRQAMLAEYDRELAHPRYAVF